MRQLSDSQSTIETFLGVLGAGNWGGPSKNSAVAGATGNGEEGGMIGRYLSAFLLLPTCVPSHLLSISEYLRLAEAIGRD